MRAGRTGCWILAVVAAVGGLAAVSPSRAHGADVISISPGYSVAWPFDAPDPHVVFSGGRYYAYTTGTWWGSHIAILTATSPKGPWTTLPGQVDSSAFRPVVRSRAPVGWQVNHTQFAPGVFRWNSRWIMYYTAQARSTKRWCLAVATASSPAGPFRDATGGKPWFCADEVGGLVDPSPFVDADGRAYIYFKSNTGSVLAPARLWAARLDRTGLHMTTMPRAVLMQRTDLYPWEHTIENPQMIMRSGVHYLLFSGGGWESPNYGQGYAVCQSALGPCSRARPTPFLQRYGTVLGPGGGSAFHDAQGKWWLAYHGWTGGSCTSYACGGARKLFVQPLQFAGLRVSCTPPTSPVGYRMVALDGGIFGFGNMPFCGSTARIRPSGAVIAMASTPDDGGYWLATTTGAVYAFGNARFVGSTGGTSRSPVIDIARTPDGNGYWLVTVTGAVHAFGSARFFGSTATRALTQPIVGMAATPDGRGYWLVARDGGIFSFGNAKFYGSTGAIRLNQPIMGMAATPGGKGYWLVASDGGIFSFGGAKFYGSTGAIRLNQPIVGMNPTVNGKGYRLVARDGGVFSFGNAKFYGSTGSIRLNMPIVGMD